MNSAALLRRSHFKEDRGGRRISLEIQGSARRDLSAAAKRAPHAFPLQIQWA